MSSKRGYPFFIQVVWLKLSVETKLVTWRSPIFRNRSLKHLHASTITTSLYPMNTPKTYIYISYPIHDGDSKHPIIFNGSFVGHDPFLAFPIDPRFHSPRLIQWFQLLAQTPRQLEGWKTTFQPFAAPKICMLRWFISSKISNNYPLVN